VNASEDPMIVFARTADRFSRDIVIWVERNVDEIETRSEERIGQARIDVYGASAYPDATFTLRLSFGTVRGHSTTPFNFLSTCDITGGNSGSPVVDRNGTLVGLVYANLESLAGPYLYNEATNRAVAVRAATMIDALRTAYGAGALADELLR
jgi:V8-like Glu-specific endopeptidase